MTIQQRFERYHDLHPDVYEAIKRFSLDAKNAGCRRYGIKAVMERVRWFYYVERTERYKVCNDYSSRYARKLMIEHEEFRGFFRVRALRAE